MSHYIPAFTRVNGLDEETVCGVYVRPSAHSNEPSCPECQWYLTREAVDEPEPLAANGLTIVNGVLDVAGMGDH